MQSKAFDRSQKIPPTMYLLLSASRILFNKLNVAASVDKLLPKTILFLSQNIIIINVVM